VREITDVCSALDLSRAIFRKIQWNFVFSLLYNCLGIPVAGSILPTLVHTRLLTVAAIAMALSSIRCGIEQSLSPFTARNVSISDSRRRRRNRSSTVSARSSSNEILKATMTITTLRFRLLDNDHLAARVAEMRTIEVSIEWKKLERPTLSRNDVVDTIRTLAFINIL
jgi:hypothetical protein